MVFEQKQEQIDMLKSILENTDLDMIDIQQGGNMRIKIINQRYKLVFVIIYLFFLCCLGNCDFNFFFWYSF